MQNNVTTQTIADNKLKIKKGNKEKEYVGLGISKIIVGVETDAVLSNGQKPTEIITDETGWHSERTVVEAKEIYKLKSQSHRNWFILDLETGKRGWFPGCIVKGNIVSAELKAAPDDGAEVLATITNAIVEIEEITRIGQYPVHDGWYKIKYINEGYVKVDLVSNLHYDKPI